MKQFHKELFFSILSLVLLLGIAVVIFQAVNGAVNSSVQENESSEQTSTDAENVSVVSGTPELRVMSFNLKVTTNEKDNFWRDRLPIIVEMLNQESPDLIGTQEGTYYQLLNLHEEIPDYEWIGQGQNGGKYGEHTAIFYKKDRFELLQYEDFWYSDTPDVAGSKWSTAPKMVTWALFRDKHTDQSFYYFNTHFDHHSTEVQHKSAELLLSKIQELPSLPVILTGDFNALVNSETYKLLTDNDVLTDTFHVSEKVVGKYKGTFNNWWDSNGKGPIWRIDWILFRGNAEVKETKIIDFKKDDQYPSDHFPVVSEFILKGEGNDD